MKGLSLESEASSDLMAALEQAKKDLDAALCNSFDTPRAMLVLLGLIKDANIHIREHRSDADLAAVEKAARWITRVVGIFGLDANASPPYRGLGWAPTNVENVDPHEAVNLYRAVLDNVRKEVQALGLQHNTVNSLVSHSPEPEFQELVSQGVKDVEQLALPFVRGVSRLRDEMRKAVSTAKPESKAAILRLSDRIRDFDLTNLGVYLDDRPDGQPSLIKFIPATELIAAREEKVAKEAAKAQAKEEAKRKKEAEEAAKWEKAKMPPTEMFKAGLVGEKYAEWDAEGLPTRNKDGSEVPKSQIKKLKKEWDRQGKLHEEWKVRVSGGDGRGRS